MCKTVRLDYGNTTRMCELLDLDAPIIQAPMSSLRLAGSGERPHGQVSQEVELGARCLPYLPSRRPQAGA
jgi:hypothetical protein